MAKDPAPPNVFQRVEHHVQGRTLAGLVELIPLLVTIVVLVFLVNKADALVRPLAFVAGEPWDFPGIGLIAGIVSFYIVGLVLATRLGRVALRWKDAVLKHMPLIKTVFGVTQQVTKSMTSQFNFSRVVFLEWPREGMAAMGFVTARAISQDKGHSLVLVYIPTVPNPTSGNMALVNEDDVMETDLTVEDAMKLVFSGGIVLPDGISLARVPREQQNYELIGRFQQTPATPSPRRKCGTNPSGPLAPARRGPGETHGGPPELTPALLRRLESPSAAKVVLAAPLTRPRPREAIAQGTQVRFFSDMRLS